LTSKKLLLVLFLSIIALGIVSAQSAEQNTHEFVVNKYYPPTVVRQEIVVVEKQPEVQERMQEIIITPDKYEYTIDSCDAAQISFLLTNPGTESHIYTFSVEDFVGEARIPADLTLGGKDSLTVNFELTPKCGSSGDFNPKLIVETINEKATFPVLLHVNEVDLLDEEDCSFYFNETVCRSDAYVKILQGSTYVVDLSAIFYDPDGDRLRYSVEYSGAVNKVWIWGNKARLKPRFDWYGKEEIVFVANDGKGGRAESRKIFLHVVPNHRSYLQNFLAAYFVPLLAFLAIVIAAAAVFLYVKNRRKEREEKQREEKLKLKAEREAARAARKSQAAKKANRKKSK